MPPAGSRISYSPVAVTVAVASAVPLSCSGWATSTTYGAGPTASVTGSIVTVAPGSTTAPARPSASRTATTATAATTIGRRRDRSAGGRVTGTGRVTSSGAIAGVATVSSMPRTTWIAAWCTSVGSLVGAGSARRASSSVAYAVSPASVASERVSASPTTATSRPSSSPARASSRRATALEVARDRPGTTTITRSASAERTRRTTLVISSSASR